MSTAPKPDSVAELEAVLAQIHDLIHKQDIEAAHELIHRALGAERFSQPPGAKRWFREFDLAFGTACRKHNVKAAYFILDFDDPKQPRLARWLTGGSAQTCQMLEMIIAAGKHAIAEVH